MKKYSDYKNSSVPWIGEIPTTWNLSQLRYVIECLDGKRVPVELSLRADMQGNIPYWGAGNIVDYVDKALFDEELVLLGEDGAPFFDHTRPVAFHISEPIWANNHIHVLRIKENADPKYIVYVLRRCRLCGKGRAAVSAAPPGFSEVYKYNFVRLRMCQFDLDHLKFPVQNICPQGSACC